MDNNYIYADNAATTKLSKIAFEEMKKYLVDDFSNPSQPYSFSVKSKNAIKNAREIIAKAINAFPEEIYFTSGGSESDNWAIKYCGANYQNRDIYTSNIEHHAVLNSCKEANPNFIKICVNEKGLLEPTNLENAICDRIKANSLISIMMGNNEIGTIEPIKELCNIAHKYGAIFHTDAVQCVGHLNIDVKDLNVDLLSASAHKFNGPKGVGFLYIKKGTPVHQLINGGAQQNGYRAGTENVAGIVGMASALKENIDNLENNKNHIKHLDEAFLSRLNKYNIDYIKNGINNGIPGIINISIKNSDGEMLLHRLDLMGIYISTGSACDSINNQISHVIKAINVPSEFAEGTIRLSFSKNNSIEEAIAIADAINRIINH